MQLKRAANPCSIRSVYISIVRRLRELGAEIHYVANTLAPMTWRFTIVHDPGVNIFIVRDADQPQEERTEAENE